MIARKPRRCAHWRVFTFTLILALLAAACGGGEAETPSAEAQFTAAAQTAEALGALRTSPTSTTAPADLVATIAAPSPSPTLTPEVSPSAPVAATAAGTPSGVIAVTAAPPGQPAGPDAAVFVADVTIPDDTVMSPGEIFEKVWRIQNTGTTTWNNTYSLVFVDGELMSAPVSVPIPNEVSPGEEVEVAVEMAAPEAPGSYFSYWKMSAPDGRVFGFGAAGNEAIWVKVSVQAAVAQGTPTATGLAGAFSAIRLSVDNAVVSGPCPHTFDFTGQITLSRSASVTYILEVGEASGEAGKTPLPTTRNLTAGTHPVVYQLRYADSLAGWARLHVTAPVDLVSNQVDFSLNCV